MIAEVEDIGSEGNVGHEVLSVIKEETQILLFLEEVGSQQEKKGKKFIHLSFSVIEILASSCKLLNRIRVFLIQQSQKTFVAYLSVEILKIVLYNPQLPFCYTLNTSTNPAQQLKPNLPFSTLSFIHLTIFNSLPRFYCNRQTSKKMAVLLDALCFIY